MYGSITDQTLYDHYIIYYKKPKEKIILVPKDHFDFLNFDNFGPPSYLAPERHGHKIHSEMLTYYCSFRISDKSVGTVSFFEIFDFEVDHF